MLIIHNKHRVNFMVSQLILGAAYRQFTLDA